VLEYIYQIMTNKIKTAVFFLLAVPFLIIMFVKAEPFFEPLATFQDFTWHGFINEANTLRGQVDKTGIPFLGKFTASNAETAFYQYLDSALTTLDTHFLFFEGDINPLRSTKNVGAVYLIFLPLAYIGIKSLDENKRAIILALILAGIFLAGLWKDVYFVTPRIPILLIILGLGYRGWQKIGWPILVIFLWQVISNLHYLFSHYMS
jgi:hypothetical protein